MVLVRVVVKYTLWIKDKIGVDKEELVLEEGSSLADLLRILAQKHVELAKYFEKPLDIESPLIILINNQSCSYNYVFKDGDEVLIMPTVSGG